MKAGEGTGRVWVVSAVVLVALTVVTVTLRFDRLGEVPLGLNFDEAAHGFDALSVLQGEHSIFFSRNYGREGMIVYAIALSSSLLGRTVFALRLPSALAGVATVFVVFWLAHVFFGRDEKGQPARWRGLAIGSIAAGMMAVSADLIYSGRLAYRAAFLPLLLCLCFGLLWVGWRQRSWWRVGLAGVCAGMLPYTYISARFTPFLYLIVWLDFPFPFGFIRAGAYSVGSRVIESLCGRDRTGGRPDSGPFCSASRTLHSPLFPALDLWPTIQQSEFMGGVRRKCMASCAGFGLWRRPVLAIGFFVQ